MKELIFGIYLGTLNNIYFFIFFLVFILLVVYRYRKLNQAAKLLVPEKSNDILLNFSKKKNIFKLLLIIIGTFFIFFTLLSPQWNKKEENIEQQSRDLFIALDISRSMLAQDLVPNRLNWAKEKIKKLLNQLPTDRIGLILFSGNAFVQCPLTHDLSTFFMFLDQADPEIISSGSTSIEQAIKVAIEKLSTINRKNKLLLIFTDGEDFSSNLSGIKQQAKDQGLNIFTIGAATEQGAPIPLFDKKGNKVGHQMENDKVVISKLNEGILRALSESCGGYFVKGSNNDDDLEEIVSRIKKFEKEKFSDKKMSYLEEQYPYFLIISFICFALEWIL